MENLQIILIAFIIGGASNYLLNRFTKSKEYIKTMDSVYRYAMRKLSRKRRNLTSKYY